MKNLKKSLFTLLIMLFGICSPLQAGKKKKNRKSAFEKPSEITITDLESKHTSESPKDELKTLFDRVITTPSPLTVRRSSIVSPLGSIIEDSPTSFMSLETVSITDSPSPIDTNRTPTPTSRPKTPDEILKDHHVRAKIKHITEQHIKERFDKKPCGCKPKNKCKCKYESKLTTIDANGLMHHTYRIKGRERKKTFYPEGTTDIEVAKLIVKAYHHKKKRKISSEKKDQTIYRSPSPHIGENVELEMIISNSNDRILTAYPVPSPSPDFIPIALEKEEEEMLLTPDSSSCSEKL